MPYDINTLPDSIVINQVEYTKTWNGDQTAFNYVGTNGETKSWREVADYLTANGGASLTASEGTEGNEAEDKLNAPEEGAQIAYPDGASDAALDQKVQEESEEDSTDTHEVNTSTSETGQLGMVDDTNQEGNASESDEAVAG